MKPGSKAWKKFMAKLYGFGAAIVIIGALFKIMHWPGAGVMLTVGLSTEAIIFIFSAFEPLHREFDWSLVYPELALGDEGDHDIAGRARVSHKGGSVTEELDKMLEEAKIEPELIKSLGTGLRSLTDATTKIGDVSNASVATNEYIDSLKGASQKVEKLSESYVKASESLMGLTSTQEEGRSFGEQMQKLSTNLASLNNIYEMQLKGSSTHLEATSKLYSGINELMQNLHDSMEDTRKYKENMGDLARNLSALNTIYGNMLAAMNINAARG